MCMTLILDYWETVSLTAGCNLYSTHFRLCVLTVRQAHQQALANEAARLPSLNFGNFSSSAPPLLPLPPLFGSVPRRDTTMYFRERDKPVVDAETFLATSVPKILISSLIIFLNVLAIGAMCRRQKWVSSGRQKGFYILPQSTQGLLHSLFLAYLCLGLLTLYSQMSLSLFVLGEYRLFEDQGQECLAVNSFLIALSISIALHLVSLSVDRTLASYLAYGKYTSLSRGTVPLWLLSIWMPSLIMGILPLAGWKSNFSFCIFMHQFKDEYLRFVSGFFITCILLIPCLYIFFIVALKPKKDVRILYRWHRKLQAHHRLTFVLVLAVNIICWLPFHVYLLLACLTCSYASLANGFTLEYLYMVALVPSILIPLMFSIRSGSMDKCANKVSSKCVQFLEPSEPNQNPLANLKKSPLFYIDDAIQQHQREQQSLNRTTTSASNSTATTSRLSSNTGGARAGAATAAAATKVNNAFKPHVNSAQASSTLSPPSTNLITTPYLPPLQNSDNENQHQQKTHHHHHHHLQKTGKPHLSKPAAGAPSSLRTRTMVHTDNSHKWKTPKALAQASNNHITTTLYTTHDKVHKQRGKLEGQNYMRSLHEPEAGPSHQNPATSTQYLSNDALYERIGSATMAPQAPPYRNFCAYFNAAGENHHHRLASSNNYYYTLNQHTNSRRQGAT